MRRLDPVKSATIDMVEASYDLEGRDEDWFARVLSAGHAVVDQGLGAVGLIFYRPPGGGKVRVAHWIVEGAPEDAPTRLNRSFLARRPSETYEATAPGAVITASEFGQTHPGVYESWQPYIGFARDALGVSAVDPCGQGVTIAVMLPQKTTLSDNERHHWKMICAHLASAHRIRRALATGRAPETPLPHGAEAVLDPKTLRITDAAGQGRDAGAVDKLRDAAVRVDRARGRLRKDAPDEALHTWWAMMHGRWSMLDWFDSDQRRYLLAVPNAPNLGDPRGLTDRELQVATYAALGESGKLISYRLGVSKATVSNALDAAMHKLAVKTQPELVEKMRGLAKRSPKAAKN
jgi:DNA-binding CsgD family transcriptional regulator